MISLGEYQDLTAWLTARRRPLLITHRRPDGDALGSVAGLALALRQLGLEPHAALFEPFPARYGVIGEAIAWERWSAGLLAASDALVILDTCALSQLEPVAPHLAAAPPTLVIDHHTTRDPIGTRPDDRRLLDTSASATALLVAEWLPTAGVRVDLPLATALLTGIATDCGWFRFPNTDARTLHVAAELVSAGARPEVIYRTIYEQDTPEKLWLIGRMLASLQMHAQRQLAVMYLRQADFAAAGADRDLTEDLVNEAGRLGCTEATILFTEEAGQIRLNFRSKRWLDVAALAKRFGGGGHARAAGARVSGDWDEVVPRVIVAAREALASPPAEPT